VQPVRSARPRPLLGAGGRSRSERSLAAAARGDGDRRHAQRAAGAAPDQGCGPSGSRLRRLVSDRRRRDRPKPRRNLASADAPQSPPPRSAGGAMSSRSTIPVHILTGFLGSGKTTLLNRALISGFGADTAIVVNEFGDVALDQMFIQEQSEE